MRNSLASAFALLIALGAFPAVVPAAGEEVLIGEVMAKDGSRLVIRSLAGDDLAVRATGETEIRGPQGEMQFADIEAGDRVRVLAIPEPDGDSVATEIQVESLLTDSHAP